MERPIKTAGSFFPKLFKTLSVYFILTLTVFFGYVQIFGNAAPTVITLPTDETDASDDTLFGNFVENITSFQNIDTNFSLSFSNAQFKLSADGNAIFDLKSKNIALDMALNFNQQSFGVKAIVVSKNLYLTLNDLTYKFDLDANLNMSELLNFVMKNLPVDSKIIKDLGDFLGIDFENFNASDLMSKLKIEEKKLDEGCQFVIGLGNVISAQLMCDENYNITSVKVKDILINGNALKFNANVNKMNNSDIEIGYVETGSEIDMSWLTQYISYAQNALNNNFVGVDVDVLINGKEYTGKLSIDNSSELKIKFETQVEGLPLMLSLANEKIYVDVENLKLAFSISDLETWGSKINEILEKYTSTNAKDLILSMIEKLSNQNLGELKSKSVNEIVMEVLGMAFSNSDGVNLFLPSETILSENSLSLNYGENANLLLTKEADILKNISFKNPNLELGLNFNILEQGFDITNEYYDLSKLLPLTNVLDEILETEQFNGKLSLTYKGEKIDADYVLDFKDKLLAQVSLKLFDEDINLFVNDKQILLQVGEVVIEGSFDNVDAYLQKVDQIFGTNVSERLNTTPIKIDATLFSQIVDILKNLQLGSTEDKLAILKYLDMTASLTLKGTSVVASFEKGDVLANIEIKASDETIELPIVTDKTDDTFEKIETLKAFVEGKKYAFDFVVNYENISLAGTAKIDLQNQIFEVSNVEIGKNLLSVRYENNVIYLTYGQNKLRLKDESLKSLIAIVSNIVKANEVPTSNINVSKILTEIFGEDVSAMSLKEILSKLSVKVRGSLDELELSVNFDSLKAMEAKVTAHFVKNQLSSLDFAFENMISGKFDLLSFEDTTVVTEDYFDLSSPASGNINLKYKELEINASVELDLSDRIYLKLNGTILDENFEILILNNKLYFTFGEIVLSTDFDNAKTLFENILNAFDLALPQDGNLKDMLSKLDLNAIDILNTQGLFIDINKNELNVSYEKLDLMFVLNLKANQSLGEFIVPNVSEDKLSAVSKIKNLKDYVQNGVFEFDFSVNYNGLELAGTFKYFDGAIEITNMIVCGENVNIRFQDDMLYLAYGNMKLKIQIPSGNTVELKQLLEKLDNLPVEIDFGVFENLLNMLKNFQTKDYLNKLALDLDGNLENIVTTLFEKKNYSMSKILDAKVKFVEDNLSEISFDVYGILSGKLSILDAKTSTITPFDPALYVDYNSSIVETLLDSAKVENGVYAFGSKIAVRYSTNTFYGDLVAMLVEDEDFVGPLGNLKPVISLYTTSLGLSSYIYLIDNEVYIDINGLQVRADLNQTSINEILDFLQTKFGVNLNVEKTTVEAFKIILPALDKIYGLWVEGLNGKGLQININDDLWLSENSRLYDIALQVFVQNNANMIVPTKVVVGGNLEDQNTTIYEDYSKFWLKDGEKVLEDDLTKNLNLAVYLNEISVGNSVKNLKDIFVGENFRQLSALKSNFGTTELSEYNAYQTLMTFAGTAYDYAMSNQYGVDISGTIVSENSVLEIKRGDVYFELGDLTEGQTSKFDFIKGKSLNLQGGFTIINNGSSFSVDLMYESLKSNDIYFTYALSADNKFRAKINDSSLGDIITIAQKLMGSDDQSLKDDITEIDKTLKSLTDITKIVKEIKLENNKDEILLTLKVDIEGKGNLGEVEISVKTAKDGQNFVDHINITNLSLAGNLINLNIKMNTSISEAFDYLSQNPVEKHIDFSGANELINALLNTSELNYYEIAGNLKINGNLIGIDINWNVPLNIKVKLDENRKPEVMAVIGEIPAMIGVNNDVPYEFGDTESGSGRMLYVYYKDGYVYFYRTEYVDIMFGAGKRQYEKKLKVSIGEVLSDPLKYLQYSVGFTDAIIEAIQASLDLSKGHTPQLDNVVNSFTVQDAQNFSVVLNMKEISNDPKLDTMSLGLSVINGPETNNKNYIGKASFNMYMPLASVFKLTIESNDLALKDIGKELDFTNLYNYVGSYTYNEGAQWEASKGKWSLASEVIYNLTFEENGGAEVADINAAPSTPISLPSFETQHLDDGICKTTRVFAGWWTS